MKKASQITKESLTIEDIEKKISDIEANPYEKGLFKIFFPHWVYISNDVKLKLMEAGYKVYTADWDGVMKDAFIIEW